MVSGTSTSLRIAVQRDARDCLHVTPISWSNPYLHGRGCVSRQAVCDGRAVADFHVVRGMRLPPQKIASLTLADEARRRGDRERHLAVFISIVKAGSETCFTIPVEVKKFGVRSRGLAADGH